MGEETTRIRGEIEDTRDRMSDTVDQLAHKANVPGRVKESIAGKRDRLREQMQGTASRVSDGTPDASDVTQGAKRAVGVAEENPIGLALGGVAAGFLVGMLLPPTKIEDEKVGPMADEVKQRAAETGQEAIERGKQVAQDAAQAATESAQDAAQNVKETVQESGREQAEEMSNSGEQPERGVTSSG
jgi:gas vesicle protein